MATRERSKRRASGIANKAWSSLVRSGTNNNNDGSSETSVFESNPVVHSKRLKYDSPLSVKTSYKNKNFLDAKDSNFVTLTSRRLKIETESPQAETEIKFEQKENIVESNGENNFDVKDENSDCEEAKSYMKMREQNLKANQEFLARIGMQKAKQDFELSVTKKRPTPSLRGLPKPKKEVECLPRRHSLRIRRIDPLGQSLPDPEPEEEPESEQRLPERFTMKDSLYCKSSTNIADNVDIKPFLSKISSLNSRENIKTVKIDSKDNKRLVEDIKKIQIKEDLVAKVVPGRVYYVTWHPSSSSMIAIAGDKYGNVGHWNVLAKDTDEDMVRVFQPHIKPVTHLFVPPKNGHKLYTSSYDATLRCGDFEKGIFDLVFSVPEENDDLFRNFDFIGTSSSMLVSHFRGMVSVVDTRTATKSAEHVYKVSQMSLRKVSVHPIATNYFITAGRETSIKLWDLRSINAKSPKPIQVMNNHTKAIASAYFSPISGNQIVSSANDNTILIHTSTSGKSYELTTRIRHNNHTGRWLTPFQPSWHPSVEGIFVSGSMERPRQIDVFDSNGYVVTNLRGDHLASVCSLNSFHPIRQTAVVGANSSGRLHVFM